MSRVIPVILAGGSGTRLWPLARQWYPKQFLELAGTGATLFQDTLRRAAALPDAARPLVICNEQHRFLAAEQCRAIDCACDSIILEPCPRSTAPAIMLAAVRSLASGGNPLLLIMPSDHYLEQGDRFRQALKRGVALAEAGRIVTFGIAPRSPETGYGYIRCGDARDGGLSEVVEFVEKPGREVAESLIASGDCLWNAGIFLVAAQTCAEEMERLAPEVFASCSAAMASGRADLDFFRPGAGFEESPEISFDEAILEKTRLASVVPLDAQWNDLGTWSELHRMRAGGARGNATVGDAVCMDTTGSLVHASSRLVATVGVENLIVVETADAVLVLSRESAGRVREVVAFLRDRGRSEHLVHRRVHRPWGAFENLLSKPGFHLKTIIVNPGARLSLQSHEHRSEHWVVVKGAARVTRDGEVFDLATNESTYIPCRAVHRLENPGTEPLELIEVQTGDILSEDDIVRYEDDFNRLPADGESRKVDAGDSVKR